MIRKTTILLILTVAFFLQSNYAEYAPPENEAIISAAEEVYSESVSDSAGIEDAYVFEYGKIAYAHLKYISNDIGARLAGTEGERNAKGYMKSAFENLGYDAYEQEFTFMAGGIEKYSSNVVAVKNGESKKTIIIGAHYDSVDTANGADDNASGIAVIQEAAELLKNVPTTYTIHFAAFGAEEYGWWGSKHYVEQMTEEDMENILVMINLDSLISGDQMYVYGSEGETGWVRDEALRIANQLEINIITSPGNEKYAAGTTGDWSDHVPFKQKGIPYAYFEATNWEIGDLDGYTQTIQDGKIYHTWKDTLGYLEENYPGRVQERLEGFTHVLVELMKSLGK